MSLYITVMDRTKFCEGLISCYAVPLILCPNEEHRRWWRDPDFPVLMSFPTRMLMYIVWDLTLLNLVVYYWSEKLSLILIISVIILEIFVLAISMAFGFPHTSLGGKLSGIRPPVRSVVIGIMTH